MSESLKKIPCDAISLGVMFSAPIFFDDGENMFLAPYRTAKEYHLAVIKRWKVPFLLSSGHKLTEAEQEAYFKRMQKSEAAKQKKGAPIPSGSSEPVAEAEPVEDIEEIFDLEELSEFEDL